MHSSKKTGRIRKIKLKDQGKTWWEEFISLQANVRWLYVGHHKKWLLSIRISINSSALEPNLEKWSLLTGNCPFNIYSYVFTYLSKYSFGFFFIVVWRHRVRLNRRIKFIRLYSDIAYCRVLFAHKCWGTVGVFRGLVVRADNQPATCYE